MSGPIVRKYGFPNFEQIFGKREPQHGIDDQPETAAEPPKGAEAPTEKPPGLKDEPKADKK